MPVDPFLIHLKSLYALNYTIQEGLNKEQSSLCMHQLMKEGGWSFWMISGYFVCVRVY